MKRFLFIPLLFLCSTLWAADYNSCDPPLAVCKATVAEPSAVQLARMSPHVLGAPVSAAGAPAGTWYYNGGSDSYDTSNAEGNAYALGGIINLSTIGTGKHVTKLSVKIADVHSATQCKVALYLWGGSEWGLVVSGTVSTPAVGWNDVTVASTDMTATTDTYAVLAECNNTWDVSSKVVANADYYHWTEVAYASFPGAAATLSSGNDETRGVRIYIE